MFEDILPNPTPTPILEDFQPECTLDELTEEEIDKMVEDYIDEFFDNITGGQL
jgi:hypothetical protein